MGYTWEVNTARTIRSALGRCPLVALVLLGAMLGGAGGMAHAQSVYDRWYVVEIDSKPSGKMHDTRSQVGDTLVSTSDVSMRLRRGQEMVEISIATEFVETLSGTPVRMKLVQGLGTQPTTITHEFQSGSVLETIEGPGGVSRKRLPAIPPGTLPPARADAALLEALRKGQTSTAYPTLDPLSGLASVLVVVDEITPAQVMLMGQPVEGWTMRTHSSEELDAEPSYDSLTSTGIPVRMEQPLGDLTVVMRLVEPETAQADFEPAELLVSTFVTPSRPIRRARRSTRGVYLLRLPDSTMPELPTTATQQTNRIDAHTIRVVIDLKHPPKMDPELEPELDAAEFLRSTPMADTQDPELLKFVHRALRGVAKASASKRAERLRRAVHRIISEKDLSAGFGSSSEVIRTHTGDCTEHAVLLAASLRVAGIPSRVASGLIYADRFAGSRDVFAFHMWTQALLVTEDGPVWVDLDATLPSTVPFDATHITLGLDPLTSSQGTGAIGSAMRLIGSVELEVESVE